MIVEINEALLRAQSLLVDPLKVSRIVVSGKQRKKIPPVVRIDIRPVMLKSGLHWQEVSHDGRKDLTKNLLPNQLDLQKYLDLGFANILLETQSHEMTIRVTKAGQAQVSKKSKTSSPDANLNLAHDRSKERLLEESHEFFVALGISDHEGKLKPSKTDKFKQVQQFLISIEVALNNLNKSNLKDRPISIVDLGCGHAYLTFAAYGYLRKLGHDVQVLGVDEREDSRSRNTQLSKQLGISEKVKFEAIKIADLPVLNVDIAIALHACDTATDDAISWAVKSNAGALLIAPCCQHDLQKQIKKAPEPWGIATRYGIMHERIGDILTDTIRAQTLRTLGYRTEIIEFIGGSHTPKNLMIRAFKSAEESSVENKSKDWLELEMLIKAWKVEPKLVSLLGEELNRVR